MRVAIISSIIPRNTRGGDLVLQELFQATSEKHEVCVLSEADADNFKTVRIRRRLWSRVLIKLRLSEGVRLYLENVFEPYDLRSIIVEIKKFDPDVILTVAHGQLCYSASKAASALKKPLVTIFHDWWPDLLKLPSFAKESFDCQFKSLAQASALNLPVCEGMKEALGAQSPTKIMLPLAPHTSPGISATSRSLRKRPLLRYLGNISQYGAMVQALLESTEARNEVGFEVRGSNPMWSESFIALMKASGKYGGAIPWGEADAWLLEADFLLAAMSFAPASSRQVKTSFPSKLAHYASLGIPLVIWGPPYCSAIRWAEENDVGIRISDPDPNVLIDEIAKVTPAQYSALAANSKMACELHFNRAKIAKDFFDSIEDCVRDFN